MAVFALSPKSFVSHRGFAADISKSAGAGNDAAVGEIAAVDAHVRAIGKTHGVGHRRGAGSGPQVAAPVTADTEMHRLLQIHIGDGIPGGAGVDPNALERRRV